MIDRAGVTHAEFAARVGLGPDQLSKTLRGTRRFAMGELVRIAAVTGVSLDWILTGSVGPATAPADVLIDTYVSLRAKLERDGYPQPLDLPAVYGDFPGRDPGSSIASAAVLHARRQALDPVFDDLAEVVEVGFGVDVAVLGVSGPAHIDTATATLIVVAPAAPEVQRPLLAAELGQVLAARLGMTGRAALQETGRRFAAAFLLPDDAVGPLRVASQDDLVHQAARHNVAPAFLRARLADRGEDPGCPPPPAGGSRIPAPARAGYGGVLALRRSMQMRHPGLIARDACRAHAQQAWPADRLAQAIGVPVTAAAGVF